MRGLWSTKGLSSKRKEPLSEFACSAKACTNLEASASRLLPRVQDEVVLVDGLAVQGDLHRPEPGEVVLGDVGPGHRQRRHDHALPFSPPAGALDPVLLALHLHRQARNTGSRDRKSTRLNSSHGYISYAVFCLKKKK